MMDRTSPSAWIQWRRNGRRDRGFTLIEALIVVALFSVFIAIAIPNVRRARIRAHMLQQVRNIKQAVPLGRINAIRNAMNVILSMPTGDGVTIRLWGDPNGNETYDAGEKIYNDWTLPSDITVQTDTTRQLRALAGGGRGVLFRRDGVVEASTSGDTGWGAVILQDAYGNRVRLSIAGGTGTVVVQMRDRSGVWKTDLRYWRY